MHFTWSDVATSQSGGVDAVSWRGAACLSSSSPSPFNVLIRPRGVASIDHIDTHHIHHTNPHYNPPPPPRTPRSTPKHSLSPNNTAPPTPNVFPARGRISQPRRWTSWRTAAAAVWPTARWLSRPDWCSAHRIHGIPTDWIPRAATTAAAAAAAATAPITVHRLSGPATSTAAAIYWISRPAADAAAVHWLSRRIGGRLWRGTSADASNPSGIPTTTAAAAAAAAATAATTDTPPAAKEYYPATIHSK